MLKIDEVKNGDIITLKLNGKLNSSTADGFREKAKEAINNCKELDVDFADLLYVSSAGLRVLLEIHKNMKSQGKQFVLVNVDEGAMEIIKGTGLARFFTIK